MTAMIRHLRQALCLHAWSCAWSRDCGGDHHCIKCGAA